MLRRLRRLPQREAAHVHEPASGDHFCTSHARHANSHFENQPAHAAACTDTKAKTCRRESTGRLVGYSGFEELRAAPCREALLAASLGTVQRQRVDGVLQKRESLSEVNSSAVHRRSATARLPLTPYFDPQGTLLRAPACMPPGSPQSRSP